MKRLPNPVGAPDHTGSGHVKKWTKPEATSTSPSKAQAMQEYIRDLLVSCWRRYRKPLDEVFLLF